MKHIFIAYQPIDFEIQDVSTLNPEINRDSSYLEYSFNTGPYVLHYFTYTEQQRKSIALAVPGKYEEVIGKILEALFAAAERYPNNQRLILLHSGGTNRLSVRRNDLNKYPKHYTFSGGNEVGDKLINVAGHFLPRHNNPDIGDLENALSDIWKKYDAAEYSKEFLKEL